MTIPSKKSHRKEIDSKIDWDFIAEKKKNPQEYIAFVQKGRNMLNLFRTLKAIDDSGVDG